MGGGRAVVDTVTSLSYLLFLSEQRFQRWTWKESYFALTSCFKGSRRKQRKIKGLLKQSTL